MGYSRAVKIQNHNQIIPQRSKCNSVCLRFDRFGIIGASCKDELGRYTFLDGLLKSYQGTGWQQERSGRESNYRHGHQKGRISWNWYVL